MSNNPDNDNIFIGTHRPPEPPYPPTGVAVLMCACGQHIWTREGVFAHWQMGHFDTPVYRTVEEVVRMKGEG